MATHLPAFLTEHRSWQPPRPRGPLPARFLRWLLLGTLLLAWLHAVALLLSR